jgi:Holliday junction resolvasome RuvABC endonuclease subunit
MALKILALDLASRMGWATNHPNVSGVQDFSLKRGDSPGMRILRLAGWLTKANSNIQGIDLVIMEQAHQRGGNATAVAYHLQGKVLEFCAENGIEHTALHSATLKKYATGSGRASKEDMINEAKRRGYEPQDDNEADAILLLEYAINIYCGVGKNEQP